MYLQAIPFANRTPWSCFRVAIAHCVGRSAFVMHILIEKAEAGTHLSRQEAETAMEEILSGRAGEDSIVALLAALRTKGETVEELVGFARAMRRHATPIFLRRGAHR